MKIALFLFACYWGKEIIYRLRDDIAELKSPTLPAEVSSSACGW
jgi:hypothetical protein